jgi:opacity protein-like surface antigen
MKKIALAVVLGALAAAPVAQADIVDFAQVSAGVTMSPDLEYNNTLFEMDSGVNVGGEFGWELSTVADGNFSVGLDLFYTSQDYTGYLSSLESFSVMANATYICDYFTSVRPFVGLGVGMINVSYDGDTQFPAFSGSDMAFGFQGQLGFHIPIDPNLDLTVGYRYQSAGDATIQGIDVEYRSHNASVGIRVGL